LPPPPHTPGIISLFQERVIESPFRKQDFLDSVRDRRQAEKRKANVSKTWNLIKTGSGEGRLKTLSREIGHGRSQALLPHL
jgi:hypothetical protein